MTPQSKKISRIFKSMLVIEIAYLTLSFFVPQLPGWKMFASYERLNFKLTDANGNLIEYQKHLPSVIYQFPKARILNFTKFVCFKQASHNLTLDISNKEKYKFYGENCDYQKI